MCLSTPSALAVVEPSLERRDGERMVALGVQIPTPSLESQGTGSRDIMGNACPLALDYEMIL